MSSDMMTTDGETREARVLRGVEITPVQGLPNVCDARNVCQEQVDAMRDASGRYTTSPSRDTLLHLQNANDALMAAVKAHYKRIAEGLSDSGKLKMDDRVNQIEPFHTAACDWIIAEMVRHRPTSHE